MKKIVLISDDNLINYSLRLLVEQAQDLSISHEFSHIDATKIKPLIVSKRIHLIMINISMPKTDGLEVLSHLREIAPKIPVLILSNNEETEFLLNFIRCGCKGYLDRHASQQNLLDAIQEVSTGGYYLSEKFRDALEAHSAPLPHECLSNREFQVFLKFIQRKPISTVAKELNVSTGAVSVFRSRVLKKLNFKSNADFIFYAMQHHLLILPEQLPH
ncbi:response regulator transcription factor [Methylobacillus gramineus]|uniref:response regulator n=1 Tax=Methylobacillus gramineus TaxID=755169 RepID=UPI001CFF721F|nr:response regulator transcription factor [Methylobacillus gramineus]MCB5185137.1 response regulator transcription factor [Methylobacillus gramineus]